MPAEKYSITRVPAKRSTTRPDRPSPRVDHTVGVGDLVQAQHLAARAHGLGDPGVRRRPRPPPRRVGGGEHAQGDARMAVNKSRVRQRCRRGRRCRPPRRACRLGTGFSTIFWKIHWWLERRSIFSPHEQQQFWRGRSAADTGARHLLGGSAASSGTSSRDCAPRAARTWRGQRRDAAGRRALLASGGETDAHGQRHAGRHTSKRRAATAARNDFSALQLTRRAGVRQHDHEFLAAQPGPPGRPGAGPQRRTATTARSTSSPTSWPKASLTCGNGRHPSSSSE